MCIRDRPIAVNVGKGRDTPNESAVADYLEVMSKCKYCDYYVLNISTPNTTGVRDQQTVETVKKTLDVLTKATPKPILVKLAPDLDIDTILDVSLAAINSGASGLVLTNTTTDYSLLPVAEKKGGLSGRVLAKRSFEVLCAVAKEVPRGKPIISVGGIETIEDAIQRFKHRANLIQTGTAFAVTRGPLIANHINRKLRDFLRENEFENISELVGYANA